MRPETVGSYFRHYTPDEVPALLAGELRDIRYDTAEIVAARKDDIDGLAADLGLDAGMAQALHDYVKPRWPELF
jgi:hypothetical protein